MHEVGPFIKFGYYVIVVKLMSADVVLYLYKLQLTSKIAFYHSVTLFFLCTLDLI